MHVCVVSKYIYMFLKLKHLKREGRDGKRMWEEEKNKEWEERVL